jgi:glycolate dehydrogenase FAD-binding subunit
MAAESPASWQNRLQDILGNTGVCFEPDERYNSVWSELSPTALALPETREQVCELVRLVRAEDLKIAPFGRGTKLRLGGAGPPIDLAISLERLNRVCDYPASDLTVSVEPGLLIRDLETTLEAKGQMLPLDVPFADLATVGGTIAANLNGSRRLAYGSWRDIVLGVQFVTAEGKLAKGGGKVVKNVAGYDIPKLFIGSLGTLGVMTEITFKVFPVAPASVTVAMHFASAATASRAALRILNSPLTPQALDIVEAPASSFAGGAFENAPFVLVAGAAGPEEVLARYVRELPALVRAEGLVRFEILRGSEQRATWNAIQETTPAFLSKHPDGIVVKASFPLMEMGSYVERASAAAAEQGLAHSSLTRAGSGIVYCYLRPEAQQDRASFESSLVKASDTLLCAAETAGGRAIVEWCPSALKSKMNLWGTLGDDFAWMRRLKSALDPQSIFSPGRYYGGI